MHPKMVGEQEAKILLFFKKNIGKEHAILQKYTMKITTNSSSINAYASK